MNVDQDHGLFEITVDFRRGEGDPSRVFRAMAGLIESLKFLDSHLSATISSTIQTKLVLQDIQATSLKSKLKNIIEEIPDDALKKGEIKPVIGHFLAMAKHKVIDWCSDRNEVSNRSEVKQLEGEIKQLAEATDIKYLPLYSPPDPEALLLDINSIKDALSNLEDDDSAYYESDQGKSHFNKSLTISSDVVSEILTRETILSEGERILKVKKPDYLGYSMWSFKYQGQTVDGKILDKEWLQRFQAKDVFVQPGDSIRALVKEEVSYGYDNEVVQIHFEVLKVIDVIPAPKLIQRSLLD